MSEMIGDDTGGNISEKNPYYSEMTALYWAWKNYHDSEYIGFCHYRRFFDCDMTNENLDNLFADGTDAVMAGPRFRHYNRWNFLKTFVGGDDLAVIQMDALFCVISFISDIKLCRRNRLWC